MKTELEAQGRFIHEDISTDTKIIPLQIERYVGEGHDIETAFRLAVGDFEGSHAISMHTDLAPGKMFLAQKGSGQTIFVGLAEDHFMPASEVYGFVEETPYYIKMDGEKVVQGKSGNTQGQIFILDQQAADLSESLTAMYYDGTPFDIGDADVKKTDITSRDIDRQDFPHYFLKEISESPDSVSKTLQNRWRASQGDSDILEISLDEKTFPRRFETLSRKTAFAASFSSARGTAGVAALACANILDTYLEDPAFLRQRSESVGAFRFQNRCDGGKDGNGRHAGGGHQSVRHHHGHQSNR